MIRPGKVHVLAAFSMVETTKETCSISQSCLFETSTLQMPPGVKV